MYQRECGALETKRDRSIESGRRIGKKRGREGTRKDHSCCGLSERVEDFDCKALPFGVSASVCTSPELFAKLRLVVDMDLEG